jgi:hypothetical protein
VRSQLRASLRLACALACAALGSLAFVSSASAIFSATLYASPNGTGTGPCTVAAAPCSLNTALSTASAGSGAVQILLASGTYAASGGYTLPSGTVTSVTIQPEQGDATTPVLSGGNANGVLAVASGSTALVVDGLTIEDGSKTVTTNVGNYGAGIDDNAGALLTVENSTVANNAITASGGGVEGAAAIWAAYSLTISDSTIDGNTLTGSNGVQGMGAVVSGSAITVTDSTFEDNSASTVGNYISGNLVGGMGAMSVTGSSFIDNSVSNSGTSQQAEGGAIGVGGTPVTIADSTFIGNSASGGHGYGGAIAADGDPFLLSASTFSGNTADFGSAVAALTNQTIVTDSTFAANDGSGATVGGYLGGAALLGGDLLVGSPGKECETGVSAGLTDGGYDVSDDSSCPFTATGSTESWPSVSTLSPLGWYGGPAETVVPSASSGLTTVPENTSVSAIFGGSDHVSATLCADPTFNDERGLLRPYGASTECTIGATEAVPLVPGLWNADTASFQVGVAGSVSLNETDVPDGFTPAYSTLGELPQGLSLVDHGNGTATVAGTPAAGTVGTDTVMITGTTPVGLPNIDPLTITIAPAAASPAPTPTPTPAPTPASTKISGPAAGAIYFGTAPAAVCAPGCTVIKHTSRTANGTLVKLTATAPGASTTVLQYTIASATLPFRPAAGQLYATGGGRSYTLVIISKTRPKLVAAVLSPKRPHSTAGAFKADGAVDRTARWKTTIRLALVKHRAAKWHVGILIGKKLDVLTFVS